MLYRPEIIIKQMLVVDLIESHVLDNPLHVEELNNKDAVVAQTFANALGDRMQLLKMEKYAGRVDSVEVSAQAACRFAVEEGVERRHASLLGKPRCRLRRLD